MRRATMLAVFFFVLCGISMFFMPSQFLLQWSIRNSPDASVTISEKYTRTEQGDPKYYVRWSEPVSPREVMVPHDAWMQLQPGDPLTIATAPDGTAYRRDAANADWMGICALMAISSATFVVCGCMLYSRWRRFTSASAQQQLRGAGQHGDSALPEYRNIGEQFRVDGSRWEGAVIASADAFYLLQMKLERKRARLPVRLFLAMIEPSASVSARTYAELPAKVTGHPDWPVTARLSCPVIVIPRDQVKAIQHRPMSNLLDLAVDGRRISVGYYFFTGAAVMKFLEAKGWPLGVAATAQGVMGSEPAPPTPAVRRLSPPILLTGALGAVLSVAAMVGLQSDLTMEPSLLLVTVLVGLLGLGMMGALAIHFRRNS